MTGTLLIMHDSPDFGGHERMLLRLLPAVLGSVSPFDETVFCVPTQNVRLREALEHFAPRLRLVDWPFVKRRGEPWLHRTRLRYRAAVRRLVAAEKPRTVLLVQGRIENLAVPMAALPRDTRVVSYLPMAHPIAEMRRTSLGGDRIRRALYRRPNRFIVPCAAVARQLRHAGATAPIVVAPNVVDPPRSRDRDAARIELGLDPGARIALFLGRLDTAQKGLDTLVGAIRRARGRLAGWRFVFVGDGPARRLIEAAAGPDCDLTVVPWTDRPDHWLAAADVLLLPSRWEGLPLVLLEAMQHGTPVLGSPIDVFRDLLPAGHVGDFGTLDLPAVLDRLTAPHMVARWRSAARTALADATLVGSRARFAAALAAEARA